MSQPTPTGDGVPILPLVIAELEERGRLGVERYGTPLRAFNGRNSGWDLYEELADALLYCRQDLYEREALHAENERLRVENAVLRALLRELPR